MSIDPSETRVLLLATCRERGFNLTGDHRVDEATCALLIGRSLSHMRRMRREGKAPRGLRNKYGGGLSYPIAHIADWIVGAYEEDRGD